MEYSCNGKILTFNAPHVMAIVNLTPDSFYDGGRYSDLQDIIRDAEEKVRQGATILDLGAASSRPGSKEIPAEEEWNRLEKPLKEIRKHFPDIFISVDTWRSDIAAKCAQDGADIINDISGGNLDVQMFDTIAKLQLPYIMMHMKGSPQTMQEDPSYKNAVKEVYNELHSKMDILKQKRFEKIILDPGFGFGKTTEHNFQLLKSLAELHKNTYPTLVGVSRKSMINKVIKTNPVTSLNGTTVLNTIALLNGANILRVHDVAEAVQAVKLTEFYKNSEV
jgi:dihydropteroate synthase